MRQEAPPRERPRSAWKRWLGYLENEAPPRLFLGAFFGILAVLVIGSLLSPDYFFAKFVDPFLWRPIVNDEGFNSVNTTFLLVFELISFGWYQSLFRTYRETVDLRLLLAGVLFAAWGSSFRVLEDADLFAPYAEQLKAIEPPIAANVGCVPGMPGSILDRCMDVFLTTPIFWIWVAFLTYFMFLVSLEARRVDERLGRPAALAYYAGSHIVGLLGYTALVVSSEASFVRFLPPIAWMVLGSVGGWSLVAIRARAEGRINWRWGVIGYGIPLLSSSLYYLSVWFAGTARDWQPTMSLHAWVVGAYASGMGLMIWSAWSKGRSLSGKNEASAGRRRYVARALAALTYFLVLESFLILQSFVAIHELFNGSKAHLSPALIARLLAGPFGVIVGNGIFRKWGAARFGSDGRFRIFMDPINLALLGAQIGDGLMTALAVDVFGASEKHALPRFLINQVDAFPLPNALEPFPAAIVMLLYKTVFSVLVIWVLDVHLQRIVGDRQRLIALFKLAVFSFAFPPGIRDALRLSMSV